MMKLVLLNEVGGGAGQLGIFPEYTNVGMVREFSAVGSWKTCGKLLIGSLTHLGCCGLT